MYGLGDIANPVISAETIQVLGKTTVPEDLLNDFNDFLGNPPESEQANLKRVLKSVLDSIAKPSTQGLPFEIITWRMRVELCGKRVCYLPQHNGMNVSSIDYDNEGNVLSNISWSEVPLGENPLFPGSLIETDADPLPAVSLFDFTVGYNYDDIPADVKEAVLGQAGYRVEFPLGVGDGGQPLLPNTQHFDYGMDINCIVTDIRKYLKPYHAAYRSPYYYAAN